jgi:predicted DCC family thiol-disulfide oxidoreductase YuxK
VIWVKKSYKKYGVTENMDSIILVEDTKCYYKSSAALRIAKRLNGGWKFLYV